MSNKLSAPQILIREMYNQVYSSSARKIGRMIRTGALQKENIGQNCILFKRDIEKAALQADLGPGKNALDLCCGDGAVAVFLARRYHCQVTGLDFSKTGIAAARQSARAARVDHLCRFKMGQAEEIPFADETFDVVYNFDSFIHIKDKNRLLRECFRVLRKGGRLVFYDWVDMKGVPKEVQTSGELWGYIYVVNGRQYDEALRRAGMEILRREDNSANFRDIIAQWEKVNLGYRDFLVQKCGPAYFQKAKRRWQLARELSQSRKLGQLFFLCRKPFDPSGDGVAKRRQFEKILNMISEFCGLWVVQAGLQSGLIMKMAAAKGPIQEKKLAKLLGCETRFVTTWLRAAYTFGVLVYDPRAGWALAPGMASVLLAAGDPCYLGERVAMYTQLGDIYKDFPARLQDGRKAPLYEQRFSLIESMANVCRPDFPRMDRYVIQADPGLKRTFDRHPELLDIGGGLGYGAIYFAAQYPRSHVTVVEVDRRALAYAKKNIQREGLSKRISLIHADATGLRLKKKFDLIYMNLTLHEVSPRRKNKLAFLRKCRKMLKPGGALLVSELPFKDGPPKSPGLFDKMLMGVQMFEAVFGDDLTVMSEYRDLLRAGGFCQVRIVSQPNPARVLFLCKR